jgi:hypothetical protein
MTLFQILNSKVHTWKNIIHAVTAGIDRYLTGIGRYLTRYRIGALLYWFRDRYETFRPFQPVPEWNSQLWVALLRREGVSVVVSIHSRSGESWWQTLESSVSLEPWYYTACGHGL